MAYRAKTGNALLDVWFDALAPFTNTESSPVNASTWERIFFGGSAGAPVGGFGLGSTASADAIALWSDLAQRSYGAVAALGSVNPGDPLGEALEQSFGVMGDTVGAAEGPALLAEAAKAASTLFAAREAYRAFMLATWQRAFQEVTREAMGRAGEGRPVVSPVEWLSFSNAIADRVFVEAFHSQPYVDAQNRLSSALADQRRCEMKLVELFARFGHFPTRRALDDVSEEVSELRRRLRKLERANRGATLRRRKANGDER